MIDEDNGHDYLQAIDEGYLPIREVSRSTGINAVTLRAWERRYGLIVPYRTPKGHRLYSPANLERIHAILAWLARRPRAVTLDGRRQPLPRLGRALDRVLLWQHYSIPNWYVSHHRLAYRNRFAFVTTPPYTLGLRAWWLKPTETAR